MRHGQQLWALLLTSLVLTGCVAGNTTMISPAPLVQYTCGNVTVRPDGFYSDGFGVLYYVVPLAPLPKSSETESELELPITVHSAVEPVFDLTVQDVAVHIPNVAETIRPTRVKIITENALPGKPWYYKTFKFTFPVDRHRLNDFVLAFSKPLHGCDIPDTRYVKEQTSHFISPVLGR